MDNGEKSQSNQVKVVQSIMDKIDRKPGNGKTKQNLIYLPEDEKVYSLLLEFNADAKGRQLYVWCNYLRTYIPTVLYFFERIHPFNSMFIVSGSVTNTSFFITIEYSDNAAN